MLLIIFYVIIKTPLNWGLFYSLSSIFLFSSWNFSSVKVPNSFNFPNFNNKSYFSSTSKSTNSLLFWLFDNDWWIYSCVWCLYSYYWCLYSYYWCLYSYYWCLYSSNRWLYYCKLYSKLKLIGQEKLIISTLESV